MSLLIVDQFRMIADSYCRVTPTDKEHAPFWESCAKVFATDYVVTHDTHESFQTIGFVGCPYSFVAIHDQIVESGEKRITSQFLKSLKLPAGYRPVKIVFPFSSAVLEVTYHLEHENTPPISRYREGSVFGFGSAYVVTEGNRAFEHRAWFDIFYDAIDAGKLPGYCYHELHHQADMTGRRDQRHGELYR